jgi:hypothetical protein
MEDFDSRKIVDPALRDFAASNQSNERRSIIVELGVPPAQVAVRPTRTPDGRQTIPEPRTSGRLVPGSLADIEGYAAFMDKLEEGIIGLGLAEKPVRLDAAQAFVMNVTPAQLRAISRWPLVGPIRPNRTHYIPPRS